MTQPKVAAFTSVCEADVRWVDQYLTEATRLTMPFAVYFDRCSPSLKAKMNRHWLCLGSFSQDDHARDYQECDKQATLDIVVQAGFDWAMSWDIDETYEKEFPAKVDVLLDTSADVLRVRWVCLWGDERHCRVDGPFAPGGYNYLRDRFYRLRLPGLSWRFVGPTIVGPYPHMIDRPIPPPDVQTEDSGITCLHWGYMTRELRELHKTRWDHNYGKALGTINPYNLWDLMLDEENYPPQVEEHHYHA